MPDIKVKPKSERVKGRKGKRAPSKEIGRQMKAAYIRELAKGAGGNIDTGAEESPGEYATDHAEAAADHAVRTGAQTVKNGAADLRQAHIKTRDNRNQKNAAQEREKGATDGANAEPRNEAHNAGNGRREAARASEAGKRQTTGTGSISEPQRAAWREKSHHAAVKEREQYDKPHSNVPTGNASQIETHFDKEAHSTISYRPDTRPSILDGSIGKNNASQIETHFDIRERRPVARSATPKPAAATPQAKATPQGKTAPAPKTRATFSRSIHPSIHQAERQAKQQAVRELTQKTAQKAAKQAGKAGERIVKAVGATLERGLAAIIGAGAGGILLVLLLFIGAIAAIAASPFGLFFAAERNTTDAVTVAEAVAQVNADLNSRLETLQSGEYDDITIEGAPPDWTEVLAIFASKTAGAEDGADVATLDAERVERLKAVFWDMTELSSEVETIDHPDSDPDDDVDDSWTEYILHITITAKTEADMRTAYALTDYQISALDELLSDHAALSALAGDLTITRMDARELLAALPDDLDPERRAVVETACQLVGKITYFWGGKSLVLGWDSRWGQLQKVTADGNSTTGTYRPYGLDCSGFVDWAFYNATGGAYVIGHGGGATMQHTYCTPISWSEAIPGDLVFYPDDEHVGIVGGRDADGNLLIVHCASSANCVVITGTGGFAAIGRPIYYSYLQ